MSAVQISPDQVKQLREKTNAGFMDCKKALTEAEGNLEKAVEILRKRGVSVAAKKAGRATNQGLVSSYIHLGGKIGVLVEINCETDFVARNEIFQAFVKEIGMQIAAANPKYLERSEIPEEVIEKEKDIFRTQIKDKPENVVEKIIQGKLDKFYSEVCLLEQEYIKDSSLTIEQLLKNKIAEIGENIVIRRFARYQLGEDLK